MSSWINFKELRKKLKLEAVLKFYGVTLTRKGTSDQYVGECPLPNHTGKRGNTFSANYAQHMWQCFGCKKSGGTIDFAVLMEGHDKRDGRKVNSVAAKLQRELLNAKPDDSAPAPPKAEPPPAATEKTVVNQPLDFQLKTLQTDHPFFRNYNLTAETVAHFGLGYCTRGSLARRVAVPLVDDAQQLVAYAGLTAGFDPHPRYLFPEPREVDGVRHVFDRTKFLYNGFRIARSVKDLVVVQHPHSLWHLWQGGFENVVALMGESCGDDQAEMVNLITLSTARIWLLTETSDEARICAETFLPKVAASRLCRWIKVKIEEEIAPDHPLLAALPRR